MSKKVYKETYFPHDRYARQDAKIKNLLAHYRRESEDKAKAAVLIYWWIVEDMHTDDYPVNKLEAFADDYRCDAEFLRSILEDFELFRIEDGCYISDRVLRNIKEQEEKSEKARNAIRQRWKKGDKKEDTAPDIADEVITLFNEIFKKDLTVSKENRKRINDITKENHLTSEDWQKIVKNAKRGWDIKGENKKPSFKNILDSWDSFKSDDYHLAPDWESIEAEKEAKRQEKEAERQKEREAKQEEELKLAEYDRQKKEDYEAITDKESALEYLKKYLPDIVQTNIKLLQISLDFRNLSQRFDIRAGDAKEYFYQNNSNLRIGL